MNFRKEKTRIEVSMEFRHVQGLWHEGLKIFKLSSTDIYGKTSLAAIKEGKSDGFWLSNWNRFRYPRKALSFHDENENLNSDDSHPYVLFR